MTRLSGFADKHFHAFAWAFSLLLALVFAWLYLRGPIGPANLLGPAEPFVDGLLRGNRSTFYGTLASINGSLLGFSITVTSIVFGLSSAERLAELRKHSAYKDLWGTLNATTKVLGLATLVALGCLLFDRDDAERKLLVIALVPVISLSIAYLARTLWILERIVEIITMPPPKRTRPAPTPAIPQ